MFEYEIRIIICPLTETKLTKMEQIEIEMNNSTVLILHKKTFR